MSENITTDTPNTAKQKRTHTQKYLHQSRQRGIGGHGGAQCGHVSELVPGETKDILVKISSKNHHHNNLELTEEQSVLYWWLGKRLVQTRRWSGCCEDYKKNRFVSSRWRKPASDNNLKLTQALSVWCWWPGPRPVQKCHLSGCRKDYRNNSTCKQSIKEWLIRQLLATHCSVVSVVLEARAAPSADTSLIWLYSRLHNSRTCKQSMKESIIRWLLATHCRVVSAVLLAKAAARADTSLIWLPPRLNKQPHL